MKEKEKRQNRKKSPRKIIMIILFVIIALVAIQFTVVQIFMNGSKKEKAAAPGNAAAYDVENIQPLSKRPLEGKTILFLGSSVTEGDASQGTSFVDYMVKLDGLNATKNAVSGTTLVNQFSIFSWMGRGDGRSYIARLKSEDKTIDYDAVVVQLSTNDATMKKPLGEISSSTSIDSFDTKTITGAMEYIIAYSRSTWNCPVIFYTGTYYDSAEYAAMVDCLLKIQDKWDIGVIDMYYDSELNAIDEENYNLYMYDKIHPTKAGYLEWWTPYIENYLYDYLVD